MHCTQHRTFSPEHLEFLWFFLCKERTPRFSTKFSVINSAYSTGRVEKRSFPGFPQKSPQTVQNNSPAIFRGAIGSRGVFHETNTPYYDYYDFYSSFFPSFLSHRERKTAFAGLLACSVVALRDWTICFGMLIRELR